MRSQKKISVGGSIVMVFLLLNAIVLEYSLVSDKSWYELLIVTVPLLLISIFAYRRKVS